jgi:hypothetical protein
VVNLKSSLERIKFLHEIANSLKTQLNLLGCTTKAEREIICDAILNN